MAKLVVHGAVLRCDQGTSPARLQLTGGQNATGDNQPAATVDDYLPMTNIPAFGLCRTTTNPQVASATTIAQGVLTPQPCTPIVAERWRPGASIVVIDGIKALTDNSTCRCQWTGTIEIKDAGTDIAID